VDGDLDENAGEILTPNNRATGHVAYTLGSWNAYWRIRYWDRSNDSNTPELQNENGGVLGNPLAPNKNTVGSYVYHDLSLGWNDGPFQVVAGITNLADKQPPLLTQTSQYGITGVNTAPEAYDTIGRQWYVSFTYSTN
jgi:hypothetical protein